MAVLGEPDEKRPGGGGSWEWLYRASEGRAVRTGGFIKHSRNSVVAKLLSVKVDAAGNVVNVYYDEIQDSET